MIMEELIRKMIRDLREQTIESVPEVGLFKMVYVGVENPDKGYRVTHWMLKVIPSPEEIDETLKKRYLELVAYNLPSPYIAEKVIRSGNKQDIVDALQDEDTLVAEISMKMPKLARDLEDI